MTTITGRVGTIMGKNWGLNCKCKGCGVQGGQVLHRNWPPGGALLNKFPKSGGIPKSFSLSSKYFATSLVSLMEGNGY